MISLCWHSSLLAGLGTEDRTLFASHFGYVLEDLGTTHTRTLAAVPKDMFVQHSTCRPRRNNPSEGSLQRCLPDRCGFVHGVSTEVSEVVVDKVHVSAMKNVNTSALIDPLDDSEFFAAASGQIEEWYRNYKVIKFGHPLPDKEPD